MPYASTYATAQDPPRTMLTDLEMQQAGQAMTNKYIRNNVGPMSEGVTGPTENFESPKQPIRPGGMDPRWADPPMRPPLQEGFRPPPPPQPPQLDQKTVTAVVKRVPVGPITAASVANRIFEKPSDYVTALDDPDSPLHSVAVSLLANKRIAGTDRYIYILIICLLAIALTCSLYKLNQEGNKRV